MVRVLIYTHFFAPHVGGVETVVLALARGLSGLSGTTGGIHVTVVTQTAADAFDDSQLPFAVVRQPSWRRLWRSVMEADVVHAAGLALPPVIMGLAANKPVVIEHHGFQAICPSGNLLLEPHNLPCPGHFMKGNHGTCLRCQSGQGWMTSLRLWTLTFLRRFLCRRVAVNITPTAWLAAQIQLPRTEVVPHGLADVPDQPNATAGPPTVAFVGRLVATKGVRHLIDAAQILRNEGCSFKVLIIGDGPEKTSLETLTRQRGLADVVSFLGKLPEEAMNGIVRSASVIVVPSVGGEVFGMVVAESMQREVPVIASDLGAFSEVMGDAGLSFKAGDAADLVRQVKRLLDDHALSRSIAAAGRQRIRESFSLGQTIDRHAAIYHRLFPVPGI